MLNKATNDIDFVDEILYVEFSCTLFWIDSGVTSHVANSMQVLSIIQTIKRGQEDLRWKMVSNLLLRHVRK